MIRKFKALGLAMVAVLAMSAVVASAAQAQFTASSYPTTGTATSAKGNDVFTIEESTVECKGHFEGTLNEGSTTFKAHPTYTECTAFGLPATVHTTGCDYVFHDEGSNASGKVSVDCGPQKNIEITAGNCRVDVGDQPALGTVAYGNAHPNVTVKANVEGITANITQDGFLCPLNGTGHRTGKYTQANAVTVSAGSTINVD